MPKKTRRMKLRSAERRESLRQLAPDSTTVAAPAGQAAAPPRMRSDFGASRAAPPISYDYSHIYGDLKRIALFAGFFFAVLIALSFVIK